MLVPEAKELSLSLPTVAARAGGTAPPSLGPTLHKHYQELCVVLSPRLSSLRQVLLLELKDKVL